jgi:hypothetical protein
LSSMRLFAHGSTLVSTATLAESGLTTGSTVRVLGTLRGGADVSQDVESTPTPSPALASVWQNVSDFAAAVGTLPSQSVSLGPALPPTSFANPWSDQVDLGGEIVKPQSPIARPSPSSSDHTGNGMGHGHPDLDSTSGLIAAAGAAQMATLSSGSVASPVWEYLEAQGIIPHGKRVTNEELRRLLALPVSGPAPPLPTRFLSPTPSVKRLGDRRPKTRRRDSLYAAQHGVHGFDDVVGGDGGQVLDQDHFSGGVPVSYQSVGTTGQVSSNISRATSSTNAPDGFAKLRSTFKLPRFTGVALDFKPFVKSLDRYAAVQGLDSVMTVDYPTSVLFNFETNKLFYYVFQEAVSDSTKATRFFNVAARWDGHGAYFSVFNGYTFLGATSATILLSQLAALRLEVDESITDFVLRLQALFDDLENVPGDASYVFNDVQRIGYLLQTIRHEPELAHQHTYIQTAASRNTITFDAACDDLIIRDDALRADELLDSSARPRRALSAQPAPTSTGDLTPGSGRGDKRRQRRSGSKTSETALISTAAKKGVTFSEPESTVAAVHCLVEGCDRIRSRGLCRRHFIELVSGKATSYPLINGWGTVTFSPVTGVTLPPSVPEDRRMTGTFVPRVPQA